MKEIYIDIRKENEWIKKYFNTDFVSIDSLLNVLEELDSKLSREEEEEEEDYDSFDEWHDRQMVEQ